MITLVKSGLCFLFKLLCQLIIIYMSGAALKMVIWSLVPTKPSSKCYVAFSWNVTGA